MRLLHTVAKNYWAKLKWYIFVTQSAPVILLADRKRRRCKSGQIDGQPERKRLWICVPLTVFPCKTSCMLLSLSDYLLILVFCFSHTPQCLMLSHAHRNPPVQVFWGLGKQTRLSLLLQWVTLNHAQSHLSAMITSGVPSVQWNPTLAVRLRRDEGVHAGCRGQTLVEALVYRATAADCSAVWLCSVLPPAGHRMQIRLLVNSNSYR